ncbi:MAG: aminoglycoside phosphotransferase family protein [Lautropia sp.]
MRWLETVDPSLGLLAQDMRPASSDASFRRYFRVPTRDGGSYVLMDAPPDKEDCRPFVHAAAVMSGAGLCVPEVVRQDLGAGFLLLSDLGDITYLHSLDARSAPALYADASAALVRLQTASRPGVFPAYDRELLLRELTLFPDWYLGRHKRVTLDDRGRAIVHRAFETIIARTLSQPAVYVHRDYHSRNLMHLPDARNPGVLDFQDAVCGPITYDLVSLLRDAYIAWEEPQVLDWAIRHWERARKAALPVDADFSNFYTDFEWMGLQRHLKVLGIFARLCHRDGKARYLDDLPRVLDYTLKVLRRYNDLAELAALLEAIEDRQPRTGYTF